MAKPSVIKVEFEIVLTPAQRRQCIRYAKTLGLSFGEPKPKELLQRLFAEMGKSAVEYAAENTD